MQINPDNEIKEAKENFSNLLSDQHVENLEIVTPDSQRETEEIPLLPEDIKDLENIGSPIENILILPDGAELIDLD